MQRGAIVYLLFLAPVVVKAVIETQETVSAAKGDDAHLSCLVLGIKTIVQVTWQKTTSDGQKTKNVATHSKAYGQNVTLDFRNKVEFKDSGLEKSSIVIKKITEQDEGCYVCVFSTFPDGSLSNKTCLHVLVKRAAEAPEDPRTTPVDGSGKTSGSDQRSSNLTWMIMLCVSAVVLLQS